MVTTTVGSDFVDMVVSLGFASPMDMVTTLVIYTVVAAFVGIQTVVS